MDHRLLLALPLLSLAAPVGQDPAGADPDGPLAPPKGLEKVQLVIPEDNPLTVEKAELGKMLFFDTRLSKDGSMSCQTCHVEALEADMAPQVILAATHANVLRFVPLEALKRCALDLQ